MTGDAGPNTGARQGPSGNISGLRGGPAKNQRGASAQPAGVCKYKTRQGKTRQGKAQGKAQTPGPQALPMPYAICRSGSAWGIKQSLLHCCCCCCCCCQLLAAGRSREQSVRPGRACGSCDVRCTIYVLREHCMCCMLPVLPVCFSFSRGGGWWLVADWWAMGSS
jgi:hypothetical protein